MLSPSSRSKVPPVPNRVVLMLSISSILLMSLLPWAILKIILEERSQRSFHFSPLYWCYHVCDECEPYQVWQLPQEHKIIRNASYTMNCWLIPHPPVHVSHVNFSTVERLRSWVHAITTTWETDVIVVKVSRASILYLLVLSRVWGKIILEVNRKLADTVLYILTSIVSIRDLSCA